MERFRRASVTAIAAAALVAGSVGAAVAVVSPSTSPVHTTANGKMNARSALTASATVSSTWAWQQFRVHGTAKHIRPGARVTLQQRQGKRWVSLPASMNTNRASAYNMRVMLGLRGHNSLRIVSGGTVSRVIHVWVR